MKRVVFELQTVDWRNDSKPIPSAEIAATIDSLYEMGVEHVGYYPDLLFDNQPDWSIIRKALSVKADAPQIQ